MAGFKWYRVFDRMSSYVYIIDHQKYEILYANNVLKERMGDVVGKVCYKELCGLDVPCEFCQSMEEEYRLKGHAVSDWVYNPMFNSHFAINEEPAVWEDGREVRLFFADELIKEKEDSSALKKLQSEFFINDAINKSSQIYFFVIDENQKILYANDLYKNTVGLSLEFGDEFLINEIYIETDGNRNFNDVFSAVMEGEIVDGNVILLDKNKNKIYLNYNALPIKNALGKIVAFASIGLDVSSEFEMKRALDLQKGIMENTQDWLASFNNELKVVYCNPALNEVTGWIDHPETAYADGNHLTEESQNYLHKVIIPEITNNKKHMSEIVVLAESGEKIPASADFFPIIDRNQERLGFGLVMHDI